WSNVYTNTLESGTGEDLVIDSSSSTTFINDTLSFQGVVTDITTTSSNLDLTIAPSSTGDTVFTLDSDTQAKFNFTSTATASYITAAYGSGATLAAAAALTGATIDLNTNVTLDGGGNSLTALVLNVSNGGAGTTYGLDIQGAADNGIRISSTTDITT